MVDNTNSKSRGFGIVTMKDPQKIEEILRNQPHIIQGKQVECKIAVPKENMSQQITSDKIESEENLSTHNTRKIFVGGLPQLIKEGIIIIL